MQLDGALRAVLARGVPRGAAGEAGALRISLLSSRIAVHACESLARNLMLSVNTLPPRLPRQRLGLRLSAQQSRRARRSAPCADKAMELLRVDPERVTPLAPARASPEPLALASESSWPIILARAQQHRFAPTESEQLLWSRISHCQLSVWFRRQVPIGNFIADFLAPSARLVVEVDGNSHRTRRAADARRDAKLARMGYRVLRLENNLVLRHTEVALERIRAALGQG
jgi:very-short-patch-repair endonuclease